MRNRYCGKWTCSLGHEEPATWPVPLDLKFNVAPLDLETLVWKSHAAKVL
jgi:hypothetical protein